MSEVEWREAPTAPPLAPGEVHVWRASLTADAVDGGLPDTLSEDERARAARLRSPDERRRFVTTRGALRALLGGYLGLDAASIAFAYGPYGKPMLAPGMPRSVEFSVSHAGDLALVVVSSGESVGVDVEPVRHLDDVAAMADIVLAPSERATWTALAEGEQTQAFVRLWTRKEAVLKGLGVGLSRQPREIEVGDDALWQDPSWPHATWRLVDICPWPGYLACVALSTTYAVDGPGVKYWSLPRPTSSAWGRASGMASNALVAAGAGFRRGAR